MRSYEETLVSRRSGNFTPSVWDNAYLQSLRSSDYTTEEHVVVGQIEKLKEDVRRLIVEEVDKMEMVEQLELVDSLKQLGLAYHFEEEIKVVMTKASKLWMAEIEHDDLYATALIFRLLRQHCFTTSQDVFDSFKDGSGSFKASICDDIRALLSLYQVSYFAMDGEDTLDEARKFTTKHLKDYLLKGSSDQYIVDVTYALKIPLNWRMERLHARWFIERYERSEKKLNPMLLELAKLDFNMIQTIHRGELRELSKWWTDLDLLGDKLSFIRDRLVENYLCTVSWAFEPKFWRFREAMTKFNCLILSLDDIYDVYSTLEEAEIFTDAVERWDVGAIEQLPEYMKIMYLALFNITNDVGYRTFKDRGVDIIPHIKRQWVDQCKRYLVEVKWYNQGYTPRFEEYMENAWLSIGAHVPQNLAYCLDPDVTKETLKHYKSYPDIVRWPCMIYRLIDDLETSTDELERGDVQKSIQCYMHEKGVSETLARQHIRDLIIANWKELNRDCYATSPTEKFFKRVAISVARLAHFFYVDGDGYGKNPGGETKKHVVSLFIEPILL